MKTKITTTTEFQKWLKEWVDLANFKGKDVPKPEENIDRLVKLWKQEIPDGWQRKGLPEKFRSGYRRGLGGRKPTPEHELEKELFENPLKMDGYCSVDLLSNAFPLAKGKTVEADMIAVAKRDGATEIMLIEAKDKANNAWYAVVENLRQLKLFEANREANLKFLADEFQDRIQGELAMTGLVIAPPSFFEARGQKMNANDPAKKIIEKVRSQLGVRVLLGKWHKDDSRIEIISHF